MSRSCEELAELLGPGAEPGEEAAARWRRHLRSCPGCRAQEHADGALRAAFGAPPGELGYGLELRLRAELARRRSTASARPPRLPAPARRLLAAYAAAATLATLLILFWLPWPAELPLVLGVMAGVVGLLGPLVLLDRLGIVLPPG